MEIPAIPRDPWVRGRSCTAQDQGFLLAEFACSLVCCQLVVEKVEGWTVGFEVQRTLLRASSVPVNHCVGPFLKNFGNESRLLL